MTLDLKPDACPFCGGKPLPIPQNSSTPIPNVGWWQFVWCENCDAQGPLRKTEAEAIAAWNRRAASPAPEGWRTVPVEPTPEMLAASDAGERTTRNIYRAMLAAAPVPEPGNSNG